MFIDKEVVGMEVILLEKIHKLGNMGEKVKVSPGYGRNYLIPQGKAAPATKGNLLEFEKRRAELEKLAKEAFASAQTRAAAIAELKVNIPAKTGEEGKLYGSIGTRDIANAITAAGQKVTKSEVRLPAGPIRQTGEYQIDLHLHTDINVKIKVIIVPEE
jgi:large subunit ribosomal protein L9